MTTDKQLDRVLAVDGGGSKTIAWIANVLPSNGPCRVELRVLGRGVSGPSNPRSVGFEVALANLDVAVAAAIEQAAIDSTSIGIACLSLAGAGRIEEQNQVRAWANARRLAKQTMVVDDVEPLRLAALYEQQLSSSAAPSNWEKSVTLVVGTGSIACGRNGENQSARVGGWGYLLGDEGSGFAIGLAGLRAVCRSHDRGEALTAFHSALLKVLGLGKPTEMIGFMYQSPLPRAQVAALSEIVLNHAEQDPVAGDIVGDSIGAMVQLVTTTTQRLGLDHLTYSLALSGGILSSHSAIVARLLDELQRGQQAPYAVHLVREPVYGPLLMAAQSLY